MLAERIQERAALAARQLLALTASALALACLSGAVVLADRHTRVMAPERTNGALADLARLIVFVADAPAPSPSDALRDDGRIDLGAVSWAALLSEQSERVGQWAVANTRALVAPASPDPTTLLSRR